MIEDIIKSKSNNESCVIIKKGYEFKPVLKYDRNGNVHVISFDVVKK